MRQFVFNCRIDLGMSFVCFRCSATVSNVMSQGSSGDVFFVITKDFTAKVTAKNLPNMPE